MCVEVTVVYTLHPLVQNAESCVDYFDVLPLLSIPDASKLERIIALCHNRFFPQVWVVENA